MFRINKSWKHHRAWMWGMWNWIRIWVNNAVKPITTLSITLPQLPKSLPPLCIRHDGRCSSMTDKMVRKWRGFITAPLLIPKKLHLFKNIDRLDYQLMYRNASRENHQHAMYSCFQVTWSVVYLWTRQTETDILIYIIKLNEDKILWPVHRRSLVEEIYKCPKVRPIHIQWRARGIVLVHKTSHTGYKLITTKTPDKLPL